MPTVSPTITLLLSSVLLRVNTSACHTAPHDKCIILATQKTFIYLLHRHTQVKLMYGKHAVTVSLHQTTESPKESLEFYDHAQCGQIHSLEASIPEFHWSLPCCRIEHPAYSSTWPVTCLCFERLRVSRTQNPADLVNPVWPPLKNPNIDWQKNYISGWSLNCYHYVSSLLHLQ